MGPLIARQYWERKRTLTPALKRNMERRRIAIRRIPPRLASFQFWKPFGAHAGAQGLGYKAAVFRLWRIQAALTHLPDWLVTLEASNKGESPNAPYELRAAILVVCISLDHTAGKYGTCALRVRNKADVAALVKEISTSPPSAHCSPNCSGTLLLLGPRCGAPNTSIQNRIRLTYRTVCVTPRLAPRVRGLKAVSYLRLAGLPNPGFP